MRSSSPQSLLARQGRPCPQRPPSLGTLLLWQVRNGGGLPLSRSPACSEFAGALLPPHPASRGSCLSPALALPCLPVWPWTNCCPLWTYFLLVHGRVSLRACGGVHPRCLRLKRGEAPPGSLGAVGALSVGQAPGGPSRRDCWAMAGRGQEGSGGSVMVGVGEQPTPLQAPPGPPNRPHRGCLSRPLA